MAVSELSCGYTSITKLLEALNGTSPDEKPIKVDPNCWEPFGADKTQSGYRGIYTISDGYLGKGKYGVVFAVVLSRPVNNGTELRYTPAAMKVTPVTYTHLRESCMMLQLNELVTSGMTPGIMRLLDSFIATSKRTGCSHPPRGWQQFWGECGRQWFDTYNTLREIVDDTMIAKYDSERSVTLSPWVPLGFIFTELAPDFNTRAKRLKYPSLARSHIESEVRMPLNNSGETAIHADIYGGSNQHPPDLSESQSIPRSALVQKKMIGAVWQAFQLVHALSSAQIVHGDLHESNLVSLPTASMRDPICRLVNDRARKQIDQMLASHSRPDARFGYRHDGLPQCLDKTPGSRYYHLPRQSYDGSNADDKCVVLSPEIPHLCLIDFGSTYFCYTPSGTQPEKVHEMFERKHSVRFPHNIISENDMKYDVYATERLFGMECPSPLPCMTCLTRPTTMILTRPAEHLNPYVDRHNTNRRYIVYSSLSDVYSMAATLCSSILGFQVFGSNYPINWKRDPTAQALHVANPPSRDHLASKHNQDRRRKHIEIVLPLQQGVTSSKALILEHKEGGNFARIPENLHDILRRFLPQRRPDGRRAWMTDEIEREYTSAILGRIYAVGAPRNIKNTLLEDALRRSNLTNKEYPRGWLSPVLYRVLRNKFNVPGTEAQDFVTLMTDALSWDPADRPTAYHVLQSSFFDSIKTSMKESRVKLTELWSANTTFDAWPMESDNRRAKPPQEVEILSGKVRPNTMLQARDLIRASALPTMRYEWRRAIQCFEVPVMSMRIERSGLLCPFISYSFFFYNVGYQLDIYNGFPLYSGKNDDNSNNNNNNKEKRTRWTHSSKNKNIIGKFQNKENLHRHKKILGQRSHLVPSWALTRFALKPYDPMYPFKAMSLHDALAFSHKEQT